MTECNATGTLSGASVTISTVAATLAGRLPVTRVTDSLLDALLKGQVRNRRTFTRTQQVDGRSFVESTEARTRGAAKASSWRSESPMRALGSIAHQV